MIREGLLTKLHTHMASNYPDVLVTLQDEISVTKFLESKLDLLEDLPYVLLAKGTPLYIVEEMCLEVLEKSLGPSRFNYFCSLLQNNFETQYFDWLAAGVLPYEVMNLMELTHESFQKNGSVESEWEKDEFQLSLMEIIDGYLQEN